MAETMNTERLMYSILHYSTAAVIAGGVYGIITSGGAPISALPAILTSIALIAAHQYRQTHAEPYSSGKEIGIAIISLLLGIILLPVSILYLLLRHLL